MIQLVQIHLLTIGSKQVSSALADCEVNVPMKWRTPPPTGYQLPHVRTSNLTESASMCCVRECAFSREPFAHDGRVLLVVPIRDSHGGQDARHAAPPPAALHHLDEEVAVEAGRVP